MLSEMVGVERPVDDAGFALAPDNAPEPAMIEV